MLIYSRSVSVDGFIADREGAFADVWCAIPKVVFSRTLDSVQGNARLAEASLAEEVAAALDATDKDVSIGGRPGRCGCRARPCRRAAHVPQSGVIGGGTSSNRPAGCDLGETRRLSNGDVHRLTRAMKRRLQRPEARHLSPMERAEPVRRAHPT
jgi:hypothetical protein